MERIQVLCRYREIMGRLILSGMLIAASMSTASAKSADLILKSANRNLNTMNNDEIVSTLEGNVVFLYDDAVIKSEYAKWWKSKGAVHFANRVRVTKKEQVLTCDRLNYDKNKKWLVAEGNVDFYDGKDKTRLRGRHADYYPDSKFIKVTGNPEFINYDTTAHDTLIVRGDTMSYNDSIKRAQVQRGVTIAKGKLFSKCDLAHFFTDSSKTQLRVSPQIQFEHDSLTGDSIDLVFSKRALKGMSVDGNAHGMYKDFSPKDTLLTQVFGDSLYMALDDSGKVDSLWIYRNVKSSYFPVSNPSLANEAYGKVMVVDFTKKGDVDNVKVWGNAKSVYHVEEGDKGCNVATGDSIAVEFSKGKASRVMLAGSVRGFYAPEKAKGKKTHE
jgi:lipopolysaccharide export system protein LptA